VDPALEKGHLDRVLNWVKENPGRALGTVIGFSIGLSLIFLGFWKTLVIGLATWMGYSIGRWTDDEGKGLREFLEERMPGRPYFH
jgi:uncharacterized membrane protein